jgi:endoglucanase
VNRRRWSAAVVGTLTLTTTLFVTQPGPTSAAPSPLISRYADGPTAVASSSPAAATPVSINGQLRVCGVKLCNQYGKPIQLRGMSTHGIQWYSKCIKTASLDALATDWNADILRISMYIQEGGYETDPRRFTDMVHGYIEEATRRGMYALVDWHQLSPGDPNYNLNRAKTFFTEIAERHKNKVNIIYDIANEPNGVSWARIKSYAEQLIPVIRAKDSNGVIFLGTHGWASLGISDGRNETDIINNPVNATNIMYTFHFYAASHRDEYYNALNRASDRIPIFVTEFGTQTYTGDGGNDFAYSQRYLDLLAAKKIGWTNWNFSDDFRSGAVFRTGTCSGSVFAGTSVLKPAGAWIRDRIRTPDNFPTG